MRSERRNTLIKLLLASGMSLALAACESSGGVRFAGVGDAPGSVTQSENGTDGSGTGSDAGSGSGSTADAGSGAGGSGSGTGSGSGSGGSGGVTSTVAGLTSPTGVIGSGGVAGTGVAANTSLPVGGGVIATAGNALLGVNDRLAGVGGTNAGPVTGTVTRVIDGTGQALVKAGDGRGYLVDGLSKAVGEVVTIGAGKGTLVGPGTNPLLGVNVANTGTANGQLGTVNALVDGKLVSVASPGANGAANLVNGVTGAVTGAGGITSGAGTIAKVTAGGGTVVGVSNPAVAVGLLSPTQATGTLATVGVGSGGTTASASINPVGNAAGGVLGGATGSLANVGVGGRTLVGGQNPAVGVSILSPSTSAGRAATVGVASGGTPVTAVVNGASNLTKGLLTR